MWVDLCFNRHGVREKVKKIKREIENISSVKKNCLVLLAVTDMLVHARTHTKMHTHTHTYKRTNINTHTR